MNEKSHLAHNWPNRVWVKLPPSPDNRFAEGLYYSRQPTPEDIARRREEDVRMAEKHGY